MKKSTEELLLVAGGIGLILFLKGRASASTPSGTPADPTGGVYAGARALPPIPAPADPTGGVYAGANYNTGDPTGGVYAGAAPAGSTWAGADPSSSPTQLSGYSYVQRRRR